MEVMLQTRVRKTGTRDSINRTVSWRGSTEALQGEERTQDGEAL